MNKRYSFFLAIGAALVLLANSSNPPNGRTGAPGDGLCSDCHSLNGGTQDGSVSVAGFPATIVPNQSYVITLTNSNPNGVAVKGGFQLVVLDEANQNAGDLSGPSANSTLQSSSGREYWEHNPAQDYPGNNMITWTVTWTAPAGPGGEDITWYAAANVANGNGNTTGDLIVTSSGLGTLMAGADPLTVEIVSFTDVLCNGDNTGSATAAAAGGTQPYDYLWSNGQPGETADDLGAGTYTVTVTDNVGATATASVTISEPPALVLLVPSIQDVSCFGSEDGEIIALHAGGTPPYDYLWSNGVVGPINTGIPAGVYTVTVTDDNNCEAIGTYEVTEPAQLVISLSDLENESCAGAEDGSISISVSGGIGPYFAEWSNGSIGTTITGLESGSYTVTVTDENDCTATSSYEIQPGSLVDVSADITDVSCPGGNDGAIEALAFGGSEPYTYNWSNGENTASITGLTAGNYLLTVTDANDCAVVKLYSVNEPPALVVTVTTQGESAPGANDGTAAASVTGGTPGYSYLWSNGETTADITGLAPGVYTVTVTDQNGCTSVGSGQVNPFGCTLEVQLPPDITICPGIFFVLEAVVGGQTGVVSYSWSTGETTETIQVSVPGEYCVTVADESGCNAADCIIVTEAIVPFLGCGVNNESAPGANDGSIICEPDPGIASYSWSTGDTTVSITGLAPDTYCVTITTVDGCEAQQCFEVGTAGSCNMLIMAILGDILCAGDSTGSVSLNVQNAEFPVSYLWSTGDTTSFVDGLPAGNYEVIVTDGAGCVDTIAYVLSEPSPLAMVLDSTHQIVAGTGGAIFITVTGGVEPNTYTWTYPGGAGTSNEEDPQDLTEPGDYIITVTDANGCGVVGLFAVTEIVAVPGIPKPEAISVFPVPATDWLQINLTEQVQEVWITAIDGRVVRHVEAPVNNRIRVSDIQPGWYILTIREGSNWYVARMVK